MGRDRIPLRGAIRDGVFILVCALLARAPGDTGLQAQEHPPTPTPTTQPRPTTGRDEHLALKARPTLRGSVQALTQQAKRSQTQLDVPLEAADAPELQDFRVVSGQGQVEVVQNKSVLRLSGRGTSVLSSSAASNIAANSGLRVGEKTPLPWTVVDARRQPEDPEGLLVRSARPYLALASAIHWDEKRGYHVPTSSWASTPRPETAASCRSQSQRR